MIDRQQHANAWGTGAINPQRSGMVYAIDGRERWLVHNYMKMGETDFDAVDRDGCIRTILGDRAVSGRGSKSAGSPTRSTSSNMPAPD